MNTSELELKAVAKAAGAALARAGHKVPHSALLHAVSSALNQRNWQTLKASLSCAAAPKPVYLDDVERLEVLGEASKRFFEDSSTGTLAEHVIGLTQERFARINSLPAPVVSPSLAPASTYLANQIPLEPTRKARTEWTPSVTARFWTDDRAFELTFDCTAYLAQATESTLTKIIEIGYQGGLCTDAAAEFVVDRGLSAGLTEALEYIVALQRANRKDAPGFEVAINKEQLLTWMAEHHIGLLANTLCEQAGISLRRLKDVESDNEWTWEDAATSIVTNDSDELFATRFDAALDAYHKNELLAQAIAGHL